MQSFIIRSFFLNSTCLLSENDTDWIKAGFAGVSVERDIKIKVTFGVLQNKDITRLLETVPRRPATRVYTPILKQFESDKVDCIPDYQTCIQKS